LFGVVWKADAFVSENIFMAVKKFDISPSGSIFVFPREIHDLTKDYSKAISSSEKHQFFLCKIGQAQRQSLVSHRYY
jgi:hypothetical protein